MCKFVVLLLIVSSSFANAANDDDTHLMAQVQARLGVYPQTVAKGTLGSNGEHYMAAIAAMSKDDTSVRLVLFRETNVASDVVLRSQPWDADTNGRSTWLLAFKNGALFLYGDEGSCGAVCHSMTSYQFRIRNGEYRLVGVEESYVSSDYVMDKDVNKVFLITTTKSINLLNKRVRYSRQSCLSSDDNPWYCASKNKVSEKEFSFISDMRWRLQDFSPDIFYEFKEKTQHLHGFIDADLKYRESNP